MQLRPETQTMFIVTGGAGFIGSNLIHTLNAWGQTDILCVDRLQPASKFRNLLGAEISNFVDLDDFRREIQAGHLPAASIRAIFHQGACSNTLEDDGRFMLDNNFTYSKELLHFALRHRIPFVYASSAAVYGLSRDFAEQPENEKPLNIYGYSKLLFDNYVRRILPTAESTVVGLRYFNAYGPHEEHKGRMASTAHHFARELRESGEIRLFEGSGGYADGEQRRDFVYVGDLCRMNLYFAGLADGQGEPLAVVSPKPPLHRGIFNAGTGVSHSFNQMAAAVATAVNLSLKIHYVPFPGDLQGRYQHYTQADPQHLQEAGFRCRPMPLDAGVKLSLSDSN